MNNELEINEIFAKYYKSIDDIELVIFKLREIGLSQMETTKALKFKLDLSVKEADSFVVNSKTWQDKYDNLMKFRENVADVIEAYYENQILDKSEENEIKKTIFTDKPSLYTLLIYGVIVNIICSSVVPVFENKFLNRTFVATLFVYSSLMSLIITRLHDKSFKRFFTTLFQIILVFLSIVIVYFLCFMIPSLLVASLVMVLTYLLSITLVLKKLPFIKLNRIYFISQALVFIITISSIYVINNSSLDHYYGLQLLLSFWVLLMSVHLVLAKNKVFNF